VTISIGIAAAAGANDTAATILKRADQALYRAKRDGRNRVVPDAA
jgi:two-component system cell cycle response regulator